MTPTPKLAGPEWTTVAMALNQAAGCGCATTPPQGSLRARFWRLRTALTGTQPQHALADPRLEAVRRFACTVRQRGQREALAGELTAQGFSSAQIDAIALLSA